MRHSSGLTEHLPAVATLSNAAAGLLACAFALSGRPEIGALLVLVAVLMDALDGALARTFETASEFGAQLDSLADVISFGVAPAVLAGAVLPSDLRLLGWAMLLVYPLCGVWRLARYNASRGESDHESARAGFTGLPSTGAGAAAATAVLLHVSLTESGIAVGQLVLPSLLVVLGTLMVSRVRYRHAAAVIVHLEPRTAVVLGAGFVAASVLWRHEYLFAGLMWGYVLSGPLATARQMIHAARHA